MVCGGVVGDDDGNCSGGGPNDDEIRAAEELEFEDLKVLLILSFFLFTILLPIL